MLTIVMYHYVRPVQRSRFPGIKGLELDRFDGQLDYIQRHYTVLALRDVLLAAASGERLPSNACVLTFDDGLRDHFVHVFPRLAARGLVGSFFPTVCSIEEQRVLDVHKIQHILAVQADHVQLLADLFTLLEPLRRQHFIPNAAELYQQHGRPARFDPPRTACFKRLLQHVLPAQVRCEILALLFRRHVTTDESAFAQELYLDLAQLRMMAEQGMEIGGHTHDHGWLATMPPEEQRLQIRRSRALLARIAPRLAERWPMAYPHGSYNAATLEILREEDAALGLTCEVALADEGSSLLELPRINTNDLPCNGSAAASTWTLRACA